MLEVKLVKLIKRLQAAVTSTCLSRLRTKGTQVVAKNHKQHTEVTDGYAAIDTYVEIRRKSLADYTDAIEAEYTVTMNKIDEAYREITQA